MSLVVHRYVKSSPEQALNLCPTLRRFLTTGPQESPSYYCFDSFQSWFRYLAYFICKCYSMHLSLIFYVEFYIVKCTNFKYSIGFDKCTHTFVTQSSMKIKGNIIWLSFYWIFALYYQVNESYIYHHIETCFSDCSMFSDCIFGLLHRPHWRQDHLFQNILRGVTNGGFTVVVTIFPS